MQNNTRKLDNTNGSNNFKHLYEPNRSIYFLEILRSNNHDSGLNVLLNFIENISTE